MRRISICLTVVIVVLSLSFVEAQTDFSKTVIETKHIAGTVYVLKKTRPLNYRGNLIEWYGNMCASVGPDGILLVDNGFEQIAEKITASLKEIHDGELQFIINTHWHQDHTGANHALGPRVPIIAHEKTRLEMMTEKKYPGGYNIPAAPQQALPTITFNGTVSIHFNGEKIELIYFPHGHTDGDIVVYFTGSKILHMGDTFNGHYFPRITGDVEIYAENYKKLIDRLPKDIKVISGHRPMAAYDDLKTYHRMLTVTMNYVRKQMSDGTGLDEIKAQGLPEEWHSWSDANVVNALTTDQWIEILYQSLSEKINSE